MNVRQTHLSLVAAGLTAAALATAGCGETCRSGSCDVDMAGVIKPGVIYTIEPSSVMLDVSCSAGAVPVTQQFKLLADGKEVKTPVRWSVLKTALGSIDAAGLFTVKCPLLHGGANQVFATEVGKSAEITMFYHAPDVFGQGAPLNASTVFESPLPSLDPNEMPQVLYPLDGAMLPSNLTAVNFQWISAEMDQLFKIQLTGTNVDASFYVGSGACAVNGNIKRCSFQPDLDKWKIISGSAPGGQVNVKISATAGLGRPVAESVPFNLSFSPEPVRGGIYYFSPSIQGLKRQPFGGTVATEFIKGGANTQYKCIGCHAISPDGTKVAATFFGGDGIGGIVSGADASKVIVAPTSGANSWNFATFSPDGRLLLTNWQGVLTLRDGDTGRKKFDIPQNITGGKAIHPDWSPDGESVAFVQVPPDGRIGHDFTNSNLRAGDWDSGNVGNIAVMKYESGAFLQAQVIVPSSPGAEYHYFPSWSPDSKWILFVSAVANNAFSPSAASNLFGLAGASSPPNFVMIYDQNTARLRLVSKDGGLPLELASATHFPEKTTSWPRFAPFQQETSTQSIAFFTFSAKFDYGWTVMDGKTPQLWMSAIDLRRAANEGNSDPSFPPFWLPFQNKDEKNHSGIWTRETSCSGPEDCPGAYVCQNARCVPTGGE